MQEMPPNTELAGLLADYDSRGGVLDYVFLQADLEMPPLQFHKAAAVAGMAAIDRRLEQWAVAHASKELPIERFCRVTWDETKLTGEQVSFETFWGTDDVRPKPSGTKSWSIPLVDGYKTAFFHPPYSLSGSDEEKEALFTQIGSFVLGPDPHGCEFFSWSTEWSNYFDSGKEWWGAFFWTLRSPASDVVVVIGASSTD